MTRQTKAPVAAPADLWGQGITFWCKMWQAQLDQSLKFWALWAANLPRPTAAQLSAEADKLRDPAIAAAPIRRTAKATAARVAQAAAPATLH
jgi:hypothetical protein